MSTVDVSLISQPQQKKNSILYLRIHLNILLKRSEVEKQSKRDVRRARYSSKDRRHRSLLGGAHSSSAVLVYDRFASHVLAAIDLQLI